MPQNAHVAGEKKREQVEKGTKKEVEKMKRRKRRKVECRPHFSPVADKPPGAQPRAVDGQLPLDVHDPLSHEPSHRFQKLRLEPGHVAPRLVDDAGKHPAVLEDVGGGAGNLVRIGLDESRDHVGPKEVGARFSGSSCVLKNASVVPLKGEVGETFCH